MVLLTAVLLAALVFEYINGFHDAANAIATVVSTKVLTPRQAILLAAAGNLPWRRPLESASWMLMP
jgi:PiT family inorganic phosphate transporter